MRGLRFIKLDTLWSKSATSCICPFDWSSKDVSAGIHPLVTVAQTAEWRAQSRVPPMLNNECEFSHQWALALSAIVLPLNSHASPLSRCTVRFTVKAKGKRALVDFATQAWFILAPFCGRRALFFTHSLLSRMFSAHWLTDYKLVSPKLLSCELEIPECRNSNSYWQLWCCSKDLLTKMPMHMGI